MTSSPTRERLGIAGRVHHAGFVSDADLPAYMQAADIGACLRWPTNGETSASWLRLLAAGRPTVITDLAHQPEVPVVDARAWPAAARPVAVRGADPRRGRRAARGVPRC